MGIPFIQLAEERMTAALEPRFSGLTDLAGRGMIREDGAIEPIVDSLALCDDASLLAHKCMVTPFLTWLSEAHTHLRRSLCLLFLAGLAPSPALAAGKIGVLIGLPVGHLGAEGHVEVEDNVLVAGQGSAFVSNGTISPVFAGAWVEAMLPLGQWDSIGLLMGYQLQWGGGGCLGIDPGCSKASPGIAVGPVYRHSWGRVHVLASPNYVIPLDKSETLPFIGIPWIECAFDIGSFEVAIRSTMTPIRASRRF